MRAKQTALAHEVDGSQFCEDVDDKSRDLWSKPNPE